MSRENTHTPKRMTHPFCNSSSRMMTISPAKKSWQMIKIALPAPRVPRSPYIPETTYATASPIVIRIPNSYNTRLRNKNKRNKKKSQKTVTNTKIRTNTRKTKSVN